MNPLRVTSLAFDVDFITSLRKYLTLRNGLIAIFAGFWLWKGFDYLIIQPMSAKQVELTAMRSAVVDLENRIEIHNRYLKTIAAESTCSLPSDATTAVVRYQSWLQSCCEDFEIATPSIVMKEAIRDEGLGMKIQASIKAQASLKSIGELIDILQSTKLLHRITSIKLRDWDSTASRLQFEIDLEALALEDSKGSELQGMVSPGEMIGLGSTMDRLRTFARYVPPKPVVPEIIVSQDDKEDLLANEPRPPEIDLLQAIRLVGIIEKNGSPIALFHDSIKGVDLAVGVGKELSTERFSATTIRFERDSVVFKQGAREFAVELGKTIRESVRNIFSKPEVH